MKTAEIARLLRSHGHTMADANALAETILRKAKKPASRRTWGELLEPVCRAIHSLGSSKAVWSKCPYRAPVYEMYLVLLRKVRDRIKVAEALGQTVAEFSSANKHAGSEWSDWVPPHIKAAVVAEFQRLYYVTLPDAGSKYGKRVTPFSTSYQRNANTRRREAMAVALESEIAAREREPGMAPIAELYQCAQTVLLQQSPDTAPPLNWKHLLTPAQREQLEQHERDAMLRVMNAVEDSSVSGRNARAERELMSTPEGRATLKAKQDAEWQSQERDRLENARRHVRDSTHE